MLPPPEKHDFENRCDEFFVNGDKKNVARYVQKDASTVSRQLTPNQDPYNHVIYYFVLFLWAFDCIRRSLGDSVINIVLNERAKWLGDEAMVESDAELTERIGCEFAEFVKYRMEGKDYDAQIREANDIVVAATRLEANLIRERAAILTNGHVSTSAREAGKSAVDARRNGKQ